MKTPLVRTSWMMLAGLMASCSSTQWNQKETTSWKNSTAPVVPMPQVMADPLEPVNRGIWAFNRGVLTGVLQPTGRVYRKVVPKPARQSITNFTRNITYPGRLVNNALQGRWKGAGDETVRFVYNTTAGVGGLFDPATKWNVPKSEADFGQTFTRWGWKPSTFVMLPMLGPSDDTHAVGVAADEAVQPWNFRRPYQYVSYVTVYNTINGRVEQAAQYVRTETDSYDGTKYLWTYGTKEEAPDWRTFGAKDKATLQTLGVAFVQPRDPTFIERGREMSVRLPTTGRNMKFNCWLQPGPAPLVYVSPGLGTHRLANMTLSVAEQIYQSGFSVVTLTGIFHPEFMENASTSALPAYPPNDCNDLLVAMTEVDKSLEKKRPGMYGKRAMVGFSMGGFQALYLAAREKKADPSLLHFDRYVAINSPVDLSYGVKAIGAFQKAPLAWSDETRQARIDNSLLKVAKISTLPPQTLLNPPFDGTESKFLVGLSFNLTLRDTIYSSQSRHDMHVLQTPISKWRREANYNEIMSLSFRDYFLRFVVPYYKERGIGLQDFAREINLRNYTRQLGSKTNVRVITNSNDFLLNSSDVSWLRSTFGSRVTLLPEGGHLGNLASPPVQQAIVSSLSGLK